jgi:hypothetical protein
MWLRGALAVTVLFAFGCKTRLLELRGDGGADVEMDASAVIDGSVDMTPDLTGVKCMPGPIVFSRATPTVMLVLDRSGSMGEFFGVNGNRWRSLTEGLAVALPSIDQTILLGALIFPAPGGSQTCAVPTTANLTPAFGNVGPLINLMRASTPSGSTPTSDALTVAANQLFAVRAANGARALVLATDGAPGCNAALNPLLCVCASPTVQGRCTSALRCLDDVRTVATITGLAQKGLPTYVLGIQSSANAQFIQALNDMAVAGGRPRSGNGDKFYAANSDAELQSALVSIRNQVGDCGFLLSGVPPLGDVTVSLDGMVIPFDPNGKDGWTWVDQANGEIAIVGTSCQIVNPNVKVDVQTVCPPED